MELERDNFQFRVLQNDEELLQFSQMTAPFVGVTYPLEYLKRSKVTALVSRSANGDTQKILGGYIVSMKGPFRVIEQLPPHVLASKPHLHARLEKALELTGLWIHPAMSCGTTRFRLWWRLFMDVLKQSMMRRHYFVYSYDSNKDKLGQMYSLSKPEMIFRGQVFIEGMTEQCEEIVEIGSIRSVLAAFVFRPVFVLQFILKRLQRRKSLPNTPRRGAGRAYPQPVPVPVTASMQK
jgi:hypothetical protein